MVYKLIHFNNVKITYATGDLFLPSHC